MRPNELTHRCSFEKVRYLTGKSDRTSTQKMKTGNGGNSTRTAEKVTINREEEFTLNERREGEKGLLKQLNCISKAVSGPTLLKREEKVRLSRGGFLEDRLSSEGPGGDENSKGNV